MSLLQGLIGFGVGATQAIAETKKQDMAAARELNLAKLKAQYQKDQAIEIAGMGMSDDPITRAAAGVLGFKPTEQENPSFVTFVDKDNNYQQFDISTASGREQARQAPNRGLIQVSTPSITQLREGSENNTLTADQKNFNAQVLLEMELEPGLSELAAKRIVRDRMFDVDKNDFEPREETHNGYPFLRTNTLELWRLEPTAPGGRIRVTNPDGTRAAPIAPSTTNYGVPINDVPEMLRAEVGPDLSAMPPADYISLGTGPIDTLLGAGLRIPIIGELLAARSTSSGPLQRAATMSVNGLRNSIVRLYKNNDGRTTNMDMELNLALVPRDGLWSTSVSFYTDASQLRRDLKNDIDRNNKILQSFSTDPVPMYTPDQREAAMQFLAEAQGLMAKLDGYLVAYGFENQVVNVNGTNKKIRNLTEGDVNSLTGEQWQQLPPITRTLIDAWAVYNNMTITD